MRKLFTILILLLPAASAHAWVCLQVGGQCARWADGRATLQAFLDHTQPLLNGTFSFDQNAINAANDWNGVGAAFRFTVNVVQQINEPCGPRGPAHACPNTGPVGDNPILFRSDFCGQGFGDIIELTNNCADSGGNMINAPVFVNDTVQWNAYDGPLRFSNGFVLYDMRRVLLHEFGHVLGLDHPDVNGQRVVSIMNSRVSDLDRLQPDDIDGIFSIYPNTGPSNPAGTTTGCQLDGRHHFGPMWPLVLPGAMLLVTRLRGVLTKTVNRRPSRMANRCATIIRRRRSATRHWR
jgi:hypothetical protein